MANPDPRLVAAIRLQPAHLRVPLLTTALIESGGRLDAVGDGGRSHGGYQEYDLGRGAGLSVAQRRDPVGSTQRAAREFQTFYDRGARGGSLAYRAQRPADQSGYLSKYTQYVTQARALLGRSSGGSSTAPAGRAARRPGAPTGGGGQLSSGSSAAVMDYVRSSERDVLSGRPPGDVGGVLAKVSRGAPPAAGRQVALGALSSAGRPSDPSDAQVVNAAKTQLGVPYSWGGGTTSGKSRGFGRGASTVGFDCSSLVQFAWAKAGVNIPRTTYDQIKTGSAVGSMKDARPGDLLFPNTGHVQMYVGNGRVIEAPRTGGRVQIVPARSSYISIRRPG